MTLHIRVWDLPTRLYHWSLALSVVGALLTGWSGGNWMVWHGRLGLFIAGLLAFRLAWGMLGSTYVRFGQVLHLPQSLPAYLRGEWHGGGHNPLGWLSVLAMLAALGFQVISGLVASDDIAFTGPLYYVVDSAISGPLTSLHRQGLWLLLALVLMHLAALLFYRLVRGENLAVTMLHGRRKVPAERPIAPASGGSLPALLVAVAFAAAVVWAASGSWIPEPPPPEQSAPAW